MSQPQEEQHGHISPLDANFRLLAAELASRRGQLVADYVARVREELPEWSVQRPELADTITVGAPVIARRAELEVALRLREYLDDQ